MARWIYLKSPKTCCCCHKREDSGRMRVDGALHYCVRCWSKLTEQYAPTWGYRNA